MGGQSPREMLHAAVVTAIVVGGLASDVYAGDPPNVVFILADDVGYGDLGGYGNRQDATPHIDRLAAEGRRLKNRLDEVREAIPR
jgi:hypothetical protein